MSRPPQFWHIPRLYCICCADGQIPLQKVRLGTFLPPCAFPGFRCGVRGRLCLRSPCCFLKAYSFNVVTTDTPSGMAVMDAFGLPRRSQASFSASCRLCAGVMCSARMVSSGSSET